MQQANKKQKQAAEEKEKECGICLNGEPYTKFVTKGYRNPQLLNGRVQCECTTFFHEVCLNKWLLSKLLNERDCPYCRGAVYMKELHITLNGATQDVMPDSKLINRYVQITLKNSEEKSHFSYNCDGTMIIAHNTQSIFIWSSKTPYTKLYEWIVYNITCVKWSPKDPRQFAIASYQGDIRVYNISTASLIILYRIFATGIPVYHNDFAWDSEGELIACEMNKLEIGYFDVETCVRTILQSTLGHIYAITWFRNFIVFNHQDQVSCIIYNMATKRGTICGEGDCSRKAIAINPIGDTVSVGSLEYALKTGERNRVLSDEPLFLNTWSPNGRKFAAVKHRLGHANPWVLVIIHDNATTQLDPTMKIESISWKDDSRHLLITESDNTLHIIDTAILEIIKSTNSNYYYYNGSTCQAAKIESGDTVNIII
jgi:WD40 repeat protein